MVAFDPQRDDANSFEEDLRERRAFAALQQARKEHTELLNENLRLKRQVEEIESLREALGRVAALVLFIKEICMTAQDDVTLIDRFLSKYDEDSDPAP